MSTLNGFSVSVPEAQEETSDGYVILKHNQNFRIRLHNNHKENNIGKPSDAEVWVQGKNVGTFRVPYGQTVTLEHPINTDGKFTAYKNGTPEAKSANICSNDPDNGLITVIWKPGTKKIARPLTVYDWPLININWNYNYPTYSDCDEYTNNYGHSILSGSYNNYNNTTTICHTTRSCSNNDLCGGGCGLSGHSDQQFSETDALDYNESETAINLRIAFRDNEPRPITNTIVYKTCVPRPLK